MGIKTGTTIECDRYECSRYIFEETEDIAIGRATRSGYTREDERWYCWDCTELRASRKRPAELVPTGVKVMPVFEAAETAGWERRDYDEETGEAHFYCCGQEVDVKSFFGGPYYASCSICKSAIADILGPNFTNSTVAFVDSDKVVTEDPNSWVVVEQYNSVVTEESK